MDSDDIEGRFTQTDEQFFLGLLLGIGARYFFDPADPPVAVSFDDSRDLRSSVSVSVRSRKLSEGLDPDPDPDFDERHQSDVASKLDSAVRKLTAP